MRPTTALGGLRRASPRWRFLLALAAVLAVGAVTVVLRVRAGNVIAYGDQARFAQWSGRAFRDRPLVGVPTTGDLYGGGAVFQPGPVETYLMAPFVWLFGVDLGPQVFAAMVNAGAVLLAAWAASLVAGRRAAAAAAVVAVAMFAVTVPGHATDALNVYIVVGPLFATYVLAWALWEGRTATLPWLAATATFVVQTHLAYGVVAVLVAGAALVGGVRRLRVDGRPAGVGRQLAWTAGVLALLWLAPLIDLLFSSGNLLRPLGMSVSHRGIDGAVGVLAGMFDPAAFGFSLHPGGGLSVQELVWPLLVVAIGIGALRLAGDRGRPRALRSVAVALAVLALIVLVATRGFGVPPQIAPSDLDDGDLARRSVLAGVVLAVVVAVLARGYRSHRSLVLTTAAVVVGTLVVGGLLPTLEQPTYHLYFVRTASSFVLLATVVVVDPLGRLRGRLGTGSPRRLVALGLLSVVAVGVLYGSRALPAEATSREMAATRHLSRQLEDTLPADGDVVVFYRGGIRAYLVAAGIAARLDHGPRRVTLAPDVGEATSGLVVVQGPADRDASGELLARFEPPGSTDGIDPSARAIHRWAGSRRPLALSPLVDTILASYVDGARPALCPAELARRPDDLLDLSPEVLASLYVEGMVLRPEATPPIDAHARSWSEREPVSVRRIDGERFRAARRSTEAESDPLLLSTSSC